jgi:hypothetical protein
LIYPEISIAMAVSADRFREYAIRQQFQYKKNQESPEVIHINSIPDQELSWSLQGKA